MERERNWRPESERLKFVSGRKYDRVGGWFDNAARDIPLMDVGDPKLMELDAAVERLKAVCKPYEVCRDHFPNDVLLFAGRHVFTCSKWWTLGTKDYALRLNGLVERGSDGGYVAYNIEYGDMVYGLQGIIRGLDGGQVHIEHITKPHTLGGEVWRRDHMSDPQGRKFYTSLYGIVLDKLAGVDLSGRRVLDCGCGSGRLLFEIGRRHPEAVLYGVDADWDSIIQARKQLEEVNREISAGMQGRGKLFNGLRCEFRQGDASKLDEIFPDNLTFDCIVSTGLITAEVVQHAVARRVVNQWYRKLRPGGRVYTAGQGSVLVTPEEFRGSGFRIIQSCVPENLFNDGTVKEFYVLGKPQLNLSQGL